MDIFESPATHFIRRSYTNVRPYVPHSLRPILDARTPAELAIMSAFALFLVVAVIDTYFKNRKPKEHAVQPAQASSFLVDFNISIRKACEGIALIGATGCGKTSFIKRLLTELLSASIGCLWATVKPDEAENAARCMSLIGRRDVKYLTPGESRYNPLQYELYQRPGGTPESFARLIDRCDQLLATGKGKGSEDFWRTAKQETTIHAISAAQIAEGTAVTLQHVYDVVANVPTSPALVNLQLESWRNNKCRAILEKASKNAKTPDENRRVIAAIEYLTQRIPQAGEKVQGATVMHIAGLLAPLLRGKLYDTIVTESSDITPEYALSGHVVVMDCPVLESMGNRLLQFIFSQQLMEAALARKVAEHDPYTLIVTDEFHMLVSPEFDANAQTQFRSQKIATIRAFQSLSVLQNAMSEGMKAKMEAMTLLGNMATKIFFSNTDHESQEYFSELCGKQLRTLTGGGQSPTENPKLLTGNFNMNFHQQLMPRKLGTALTNLKTGGESNDFSVSCYVHQSGTRFDNGLPFTKVTFKQDLR